jgi:hypothetical protein
MASYPTFLTYQATGGRKEDVLDLITSISPEETPLLSRLGVSNSASTIHQWLQDSIDSGTATGAACIEGESATARTISDRSRLQNYTQISEYVFGVSGTQEAVSHYGLDSEYSFQLEKAMKILKIMQEQILINSTSATGSSSVARSLTGIISALQTNVQTGSAGVCALSETLFNNLLQTVFEAGGKPDVCYVGGFLKRKISAFATSNTRQIDMTNKSTLRNFVSVYESDFGTIEIILDRYIPAGTGFVLQADMWKIAYLRKPFVQSLALDGDRKRAQIIAEYTLEYLNEKSSGKLSAMGSA